MITSDAFAHGLAKGFVYLEEVDPTIIQNLRYYSEENFIGRKIDGYKSNKVILTVQAANALPEVQQELLKEGYSLVIYDGYRPQRAVNQFLDRAADHKDQD